MDTLGRTVLQITSEHIRKNKKIGERGRRRRERKRKVFVSSLKSNSFPQCRFLNVAEDTKKQKVERKVKQTSQREHPLVAVDWDTFRQEELRRIIEANPDRYVKYLVYFDVPLTFSPHRYSKDMEGQRLMETMLIIIARYNELKEMVEQVKNKKRKFLNAAPEGSYSYLFVVLSGDDSFLKFEIICDI